MVFPGNGEGIKIMNMIELRERCQRTLNDASGATFSDDLVDGWIRAALEEYSQHFNKVVDVQVSGIVAGTYAYAVTERVGSVMRVEYPEGQDPPKYAQRRPYGNNEFFLHADSYDFIQTKGESAGILFLSDPTQDSTATITALRTFDETATELDIPAKHEPILIARVRWQARQFQADGELLAPTSNSSLLMAQMEQNAKSARKDYYQMLYNAVLTESGGSVSVRWEMDKYGQVY
jgi:hypothetical protein